MDKVISSSKQICPFCGRGELKVHKKNSIDSGAKEKAAISSLNKMLLDAGLDPLSLEREDGLFTAFKCSSCGCEISAADLDNIELQAVDEMQESSPISGHSDVTDPDVRSSAEETLNSAWQLMLKLAWVKAAKILAPPYPPSHTLEFTVYRSICDTAPLFRNTYDSNLRCEQLNILGSNIKNITKNIAKEHNGETYLILQRVHQALMMLGDLWLACGTIYNAKRVFYADRTNYHRSKVLCNFAECLESLSSDAQHGTEYLKMAVELYHKCLEASREKYCHIILSREITKLQLPPPFRKHINDKITELNAAISKRDSSFTPRKALANPKILPMWLLYFTAFFPVILLTILMMLDSSDNQWVKDNAAKLTSAALSSTRLDYYIVNGYLPAFLAIFAAASGLIFYKKYYNS